LVLAILGEPHRSLERSAGLGSLAGLPPLIAAPAAHRGDDQDAQRDDEVAVALPQLDQPFAAYFLVDFLEDVGHRPVPNTPEARPKPAQTAQK